MSLFHGDSLAVLRDLPPDSVDAVVTDPPYGLAFMGKKWDYDVPSVEVWREVLRVLKPGGHLLSFGGTRTYHRMVVAIEDAGFEIRDQIQWIYGSGFPKSLDVSKAIDKAAGAEREVVGMRESPYTSTARNDSASIGKHKVEVGENGYERHPITAPATPAAIKWQGWATALKPANEPIVLARKPLSEKTVAKNVLKHGTGALNIDGTRIASNEKLARPFNEANNEILGTYARFGNPVEPPGRWPANVLFDEQAAALLDEQSGVRVLSNYNWQAKCESWANMHRGQDTGDAVADAMYSFKAGADFGRAEWSGGASRFFYVAKSSKKDRSSNGAVNNIHPTCKPTKLMEYLCRLVTPPGGTVLDPFMGSGSTGVAAKSLGFNFIGIEREAEYVEIARRRIEHSA